MQASNRFKSLSLACGVVLATGAAVAADPAGSAGACFEAAFEANDADAVGACYAEDAIIWFPGGSMAKGRPAIRDGFAHYLGMVTIKDVEMTTIGHESAGDARIAWGTYAIRTVDRTTGVETTQRGRFTDVQKKIDGRWLYTVDHPSDDPIPAAQ